jgi:ethanolaminephosphotransferase
MTFYVQTWDEYYTQILTLGVVSGPVEGILTLCVVYLFTAYMGGGSFWHQGMLETIGVSKPSFLARWVYDMPFTQWYLVYGSIVLCFAIGSSIMHVMKVRRERGQDPFSPLYGLLPLAVIWTLIPAYLYLQPVILRNYAIPFGLFVSLITAYSVGRIIIGHLTQTSFPYQNVLLYPLALGVLDSAGALIGLWSAPVLGYGVGQVAFVFGCLGLAIGVYGSFVVCCRLVVSPARDDLLIFVSSSLTSSPRYAITSISGASQSSTHSSRRPSARAVFRRRTSKGITGVIRTFWCACG